MHDVIGLAHELANELSQEERLDLVRRRFGGHPILDDSELDLAAVYAADVVLHGPGERFEGIDGIKQAAAETRAAFSDIEFRIDEMTARARPGGDEDRRAQPPYRPFPGRAAHEQVGAGQRHRGQPDRGRPHRRGVAQHELASGGG